MMKKILLALALASASSLFAVDNMGQWFNATPVDAETPVPWSLNGEDGSVITNTTAASPYWEIDADVTKAGTEEKTIFTPPSMTDLGLFANTITRVDISTTFDAMYDMTTEEGHPENFIGEDQPLDPPTGSLGALIVGSTTNTDEVVTSSNFYAYVGSTWKKLVGDGSEVPDSLTGKVVHVRIELLYLYGVNKLRYSIGKVDGSGVTNYVALADADGETLFPFEATGQNITGVEFSGCGKVHQVASAVRNCREYDGGKGSEPEPYLLASADTFLEYALNGGSVLSYFKLDADVTLPTWAGLTNGSDSVVNLGFDGAGHTITIKNLTGSGFFESLDGSGNTDGITIIKDLTIHADNVTVADDAALFVGVCKDNVKFVNCKTTGSLTSTVQNKKLAGFVCMANNSDHPTETSVTFENCTNEVALTVANGSTVTPAAFVAEIDYGKVAATPDTTLVTVGGYDSYGTLVEGQGSVDCAFNFYTNGVAGNANNIYYVKPKLSPLNAETIPTYWIAKENADVFEFEAAGKLQFEFNGEKFNDPPYDVESLTVAAGSELVVEGYSADDGEYSPGSPAFDENNFCSVFVNPLVATMTWYYEEEEVYNQGYSSLTYVLQNPPDSPEEDFDRQVLSLSAGAVSATLLGSGEVSGFEFELGGCQLTICENEPNGEIGNFSVGSEGVLCTTTTDPLQNISIQLKQDGSEVEGENSVTFSYGAVVYGNSTLWLDYDGFTEDDTTPAFARLSGGSIIVTNVGNTHKDFLFDATGVDEGNSCATIYVSDQDAGNDTYTLAEGAVVALAGGLSPDKLQAPLGSGLCITKTGDPDENLYTTREAVCMINGKGYATFEDALAAAADGATIDLVDGAAVTISATTISKNLFITNSTGTGTLTIGGAVSIAADKTLNLSGFTLDTDLIVSDGSFVIANGATLQWDGVNPTTLGEIFAGSANGAIFIGDTTYTWNGSEWVGEQPVVNYVCQIVVSEATTNKYETLSNAIAQATSGQTVQLIANVSVEFDTAAYATIPADVSLTLDLNGKKFFASSVGQLREHKVFNIPEGCAFTIMDSATGGEVEYCETVPTDFADGAYIVKNKGTFTLASGKLTAYGKCKGKVWGEPCWGIVCAVLNDVNSNNKDDQPVVFNMTGGELNIWAHGQTFEDPDKPGSTYPEYNGISGIAINQYDATDDNIINISGGVIKGGTLRSGLREPYQKAAVKSAVIINITGGILEGRFDIDNYGATEVNIKNAKIVSNADGAFEPWFRAAGTAANQPYVTIDAATVEASSLRFPLAFNTANIEVVGGLFDQKEKVTYATTPYYYSGTITEDVVALKDLVPPVVCKITDNETDPASYTVEKIPVPLTVTKNEHVSTFSYTINGEAAGANPTVVYGDIVEIGAVTYEFGYGAGTVKEGEQIVMDLSKLVAGEPAALVESVTITVDAVARTYFDSGTGSEADPYIINAAQHLVDLKDWVAAGQPTAGKYFKQETDIDMAGMPPWPGIGEAAAGKRFSGVYDGGNHTIRNMTLAKINDSYNRGLFAVVDGATIKNLEVDCLGFDTTDTTMIKWGGGVLVGYVNGGAMISNVTTKGVLDAFYTAGGMIGSHGCADPSGPEYHLTFVDCTNEVALSGNYDKHGGFIGYSGYVGDSNFHNEFFIRCHNKGNVTVTLDASRSKAGASAFVGYSESNQTQTFVDCVAEGVITVDKTAKPGVTETIGAFIGYRSTNGNPVIGLGTNVASAQYRSVGAEIESALSNLSFATVEGGVATFVADDVFLSAINESAPTYKMMASGGTAMLEAGTWKFDVSLFDAEALNVATTSVNANPVKSAADENNIVTVTVTALTESAGVFEVDETVESIPQTGNIKITLEDAKKVSGYSEITEFPTDDDFKAKLNATDTAGVPLWQKLVLGLAADQKPTVKATQDAVTDKVTFSLGTLKSVEQIRNTGAKVKFCLVGAVDGELKEVGETLELPIDSLFQGDDKAKRIKVKVVFEQANQKPKTN